MICSARDVRPENIASFLQIRLLLSVDCGYQAGFAWSAAILIGTVADRNVFGSLGRLSFYYDPDFLPFSRRHRQFHRENGHALIVFGNS